MPKTGSPTLKWSPTALADIQRLREFIETHNPDAAGRGNELKTGGKYLDDTTGHRQAT
jgi:plasmid stabilization system protein ParE